MDGMRGGAASRMPRFPARGGPTNRPQRSCRGRIPATGQGDGETRFPRPPAHGLRPYLPAGGAWGNAVSPSPCLRVRPSCGRGRGETGFPILLRTGCALTFPRAGVWGNAVSPRPLLEGQTLLRAGGWGNLVPPCSPQPSMRLAPHPDGMKKGSSWEGCALANPPTGGGMGKPGFPIPLPGGGVGKPGFPTPLLQQPMFTSGLWRIMPGCLKSPAEEPAHD